MAGPVTEEERVTLLIKIIIIILTGALLETWPVLVLAAENCKCTLLWKRRRKSGSSVVGGELSLVNFVYYLYL